MFNTRKIPQMTMFNTPKIPQVTMFNTRKNYIHIYVKRKRLSWAVLYCFTYALTQNINLLARVKLKQINPFIKSNLICFSYFVVTVLKVVLRQKMLEKQHLDSVADGKCKSNDIANMYYSYTLFSQTIMK